MKLDILIAGVGGQGTLLSSRVLGTYAQLKGLDCKLSEVHGMAQRGGSVITHVRMSENVLSPIIDTGTADVLIAYETLEAIRYSDIVKEGGLIIYSTQRIMPMPVVSGGAKYPDDADKRLPDAKAVDAVSIAKAAGNEKTANIVILGVLAKAIDLDYHAFLTAIKQNIPQKLQDVNIKAFDAGYNL